MKRNRWPIWRYAIRRRLERLRRLAVTIHERAVWQALAVFLGASVALLEGVDVLITRLGLPDGLFSLALVLLVIGLPMVVVTAWVQTEEEPDAFTRRSAPGGSSLPRGEADGGAESRRDLARVLTWRNAVGGGVLAFAGWGVIAATGTMTGFLEHRSGPEMALVSASPSPTGGEAEASLLRSGALEALDPKRVVVAHFENQTGDPSLDHIGQMTADWLVQGLSGTRVVDVVPPTTSVFAARFHRDRARSDPSVDPVRAIALETGAGIVVDGAYYLDGASIRIHPRITDVRSGRLIGALPAGGAPADRPLPAIDAVRQRVMGTLARVLDPRLGEIGSRDSRGFPTYDAYVSFSRGLDSFVARDFVTAIGLMRHAAALDSSWATPLVWASLGAWFGDRHDLAGALAGAADQRSASLLPVDRLFVDYVVALTRMETGRALELAREGFDATSGSLWRYSYGTILLLQRRPREAIEVLDALDPAGSLMAGWTQYWLWPTQALHTLGDHETELERARWGRRQYPDDVRVAIYEAIALAALGWTDELWTVLNEAEGMSPSGSITPVDVMRYSAEELRAHGQEEESRRALSRSLAALDVRATKGPATPEDIRERAAILYLLGRWDQAERIYRQLDEEDPKSVGVVSRLGAIAARRGDVDAARAASRRLETLERHPVSGASHPVGQARIAALLGEEDRAVALLREAFTNGTFWGAWLHRDVDLEGLHHHPGFQALLRPVG